LIFSQYILIIGDLDMDKIVAEIEKRYKFIGDKEYQIKSNVPLKEKEEEQGDRLIFSAIETYHHNGHHRSGSPNEQTTRRSQSG
jgi:hypothetical protein